MVKEDTPEIAAPKKLVLSLVRRTNEIKTRMQGIGGELGAEIKDSVENKHLHSGAMKLIAKMARMDEIKRAEFIRAYHLYWSYATEANLFGEKHAGDLIAGAAESDGPPRDIGGAEGSYARSN